MSATTDKSSRSTGGAKLRARLVTAGIVVALFAVGVAVNLHYAPRGFMPLDQSVVFDGGWRILSGQVPYRDFTPRTGLVPSVFQVGFFAAFGVTWFAYCLHASVLNGLFCVLVYAFLRLQALTRIWGIVWAALSAMVFYPPSGTPYMENHASFFVFFLIILLMSVRETLNQKLRCAVWMALPFGWILVFMSKQNVAAFAILPLVLAGILSFRERADMRTALRSLAIGTVLCIAGLAAVAAVAGLDPSLLWRDLFLDASATGASRFTYGFLKAQVRHLFLEPHPVASALISGLATLLLFRLVLALRDPASRRSALELLLPTSLMALSLVFVLTTMNQHDNGWPYLFCFLGMVHARSGLLLPAHRSAQVFRVLVLLFAAACVQYFAVSNSQRRFHDIVFESQSPTRPRTEALRFMRLQVPRRLRTYSAADLDAVIAFLKSQPENFFLLGDSSILYALTGKPSVNPQLFFHSLMRTTTFTALRRRLYEDRLFERFTRYNVGFVVLEGRRTWTGVQLATLTQLERFVRGRTIRTHSFGYFQVLDVRPAATTEFDGPAQQHPTLAQR